MDAVKLVNGAVLGYDGRTVLVNGKCYIVSPPTIAKIAGAAYWLADLADLSGGAISVMANIKGACRALSWFIQGDEALCEELSEGTVEEITEAIETAYSLISAESFIKLSTLAKNVGKLTANQRPR